MEYIAMSQTAAQSGGTSAGTIVVLIALIVIVALIAYRLIKNHKEGKSSCGCGCSSCKDSGCATESMIENLQSAKTATKQNKK